MMRHDRLLDRETKLVIEDLIFISTEEFPEITIGGGGGVWGRVPTTLATEVLMTVKSSIDDCHQKHGIDITNGQYKGQKSTGVPIIGS